MNSLLHFFSKAQLSFNNLLRISVFIVMVWIGGLKVFPYEADGIVPFVANSPVMSFFYNKQAPEYQDYKNPEGRTSKVNSQWHKENGTYTFSNALGMVIISIGIVTLLGIWFPKTGFAGGLLTVGMSIVTLSFLITTPEVYVPNLGGDYPTPDYGFPYLSGAGRLVLKDVIMLAAGLVISSDAASRILAKENRRSL
ncbi:DUF417 family protein [Flavobacterium anhuiense]|uniref:DUF417 family protein n=1 Tax=Flavobacterium anhuiense TaxID=459526 RepID=UPI001FCCCE85|nr:DUF417 family protein [Flavobacterium anhuiense]